ncbi:MAG: transcriptional regulator [Pseudomonadota bacterium]
MLIQAPFMIGILDDPNTSGRELHLDFTDEFRALPREQQPKVLEQYLGQLQQEILRVPEDSADRQGMLMIQQVAEQLLPHIAAGEVSMQESIVIELQQGSPLGRFFAE